MKIEITYKEMPKLRPISIPTKGKSFFGGIYVWMFKVRTWEVVDDWVYEIDGVEYVIRTGFIFDGASIPRSFWHILNPIGILLIPGLIHDWAYKYAGLERVTKITTRKIHSETISMNQADSDSLFYQTAVSINGLKFVNWLAYKSLRLFGFFAWNKHRKGG